VCFGNKREGADGGCGRKKEKRKKKEKKKERKKKSQHTKILSFLIFYSQNTSLRVNKDPEYYVRDRIRASRVSNNDRKHKLDKMIGM
jgi:hypothetical protein